MVLGASRLGEPWVGPGGYSGLDDAPSSSPDALIRQILQNSGDGIELLALDGSVLAINQVGLALLGLQDEAVIVGGSWIANWPPEIRPAAMMALGEAQAGRIGRFRIAVSSGGMAAGASYDVAVMPAASASGGAGRLLSIARLAMTEEPLRQSQKMEAVCQLTSGIAHDFNNLLTGVMGSIEMMRNRVRQGRLAELPRYMDAAAGAAAQAASLTQRLLAFSRRQTLVPRPVGADALVAAMEDRIRQIAGGNSVTILRPPGLWMARCDPAHLEHAVLHLVLNAVEAMADGGSMIIETSNIDCAQAEPGSETPAGDYVAVAVTDTGCGMSAEVSRRAFDPYFTTKAIGQGTGMGLSMIHGFARQSGGDVRIASIPGHGSRVTIYLPRHVVPEPGWAQAG